MLVKEHHEWVFFHQLELAFQNEDREDQQRLIHPQKQKKKVEES